MHLHIAEGVAAMFRTYIALGAINMLLAVALGAFGAHGLEGRIEPNLMSAYETGVQYHQIHALGLLAIALAADRCREAKLVSWAGRLIMLGIVLFSGSLYVMALSGIGILGAITPFGGVSFLAGWACLAAAALKSK
jgi:uncharacterized membrane protein YgdD (TMEM256/DUF423 family)